MSIDGNLLTRADAKEASISLKVIRANGTVEELGVVSYWHKNPFKRFWGNLRIKLKESKK